MATCRAGGWIEAQHSPERATPPEAQGPCLGPVFFFPPGVIFFFWVPLQVTSFICSTTYRTGPYDALSQASGRHRHDRNQ